jgi:hypothetical protein
MLLKNKYFLLIFIIFICYISLYVRFYYFNFNSLDSNIYIENREGKIRNDNKLTLYEIPNDIDFFHKDNFNNSTKILSSIKNSHLVHRIFFPRILYFDATTQEQLSVFVFHPTQSNALYPILNITQLKQTSPINVYDPNLEIYPLFDTIEYTEIPVIGKQAIMIPKGWWVYMDDTNKMIEKTIFY